MTSTVTKTPTPAPNMSYPYFIPATPKVISPSPTLSEAGSGSEKDSYFGPTTRSTAKRHTTPDSIPETADDVDDSNPDARARTRSRSPALTPNTLLNGSASSSRRRVSGMTKMTDSRPPINGSTNAANKKYRTESNGHLTPFPAQQKKPTMSWREFSRSPSPLGLIPLHRHYKTLIHKHEIPRKFLHVSIGFVAIRQYTSGYQSTHITPYALAALVPITITDLLRHRYPSLNRIYIRCLGFLMREVEVEGYNGVIWYLLGVYISLRFFPRDIAAISVLLLSWCDTAASTFGRLYGKYTIRLRRGKSLAGSLAAFITGALTAAMFWGYIVPRTPSFPDDPPNSYMYQGYLGLSRTVTSQPGWPRGKGFIQGTPALVVMSLVTGLVASASEFVDLWGLDDNLTIPVLSCMGLWGFLKLFGG